MPYRGTGPAIADLVGGQVPIGIVGVTGQVLEFHRTGKMRVLAVTSPTRLTAAPELPTAAELGFPGMTVTGSIGLLAPAGTPVEIIEQIAQATRTAVAEPAYQQMLTGAGMESTLDSDPEKFRQIACRRYCPLDAGRQSARAEDRLRLRLCLQGGRGRRHGAHAFDGAGSGVLRAHSSCGKSALRVHVAQFYLALMPAVVMIGHHFAISALWKAPNPSGV